MPADASEPVQKYDRADQSASEQPADARQRARHYYTNLSALMILPGVSLGQPSAWYQDAIGCDPLAGRSELGVKPWDAG